jgi:hypothetical protein
MWTHQNASEVRESAVGSRESRSDQNDQVRLDIRERLYRMILLEFLLTLTSVRYFTSSGKKEGRGLTLDPTVPLMLSRTRSIATIRSRSVKNMAVAGESGSQIKTLIPTAYAIPPKRM